MLNGFLIKRRMFDLQLRNVDLIKEINKRRYPYISGHSGILQVNSPDMSRALNDVGSCPKHQAILEAADKIISEWERKKHDA